MKRVSESSGLTATRAVDPTRTLGSVKKVMCEAAHLAAAWRREARGRAPLERRSMARECHIGGETENPIDPVRPAPSNTSGPHVAVGAQQDPDLGPTGAAGGSQAAHKKRGSPPRRPLAQP
jgi:hypothetical protein